MKQEPINEPTLEDFIEQGRAMESVIESAADVVRSQHEDECRAASECRELAIGLIAIALSYVSGLTEDGSPDAKAEYRLACAVAFAQGASISGSLIAQGQYMKAAAALKQDLELIARFYEVVNDRAVEGRTPNVSCGPEGGGRVYGELNKVAHPSNLDEMCSVLSAPSGQGFIVRPSYNETTGPALYQVHVWICAEMARAVLTLLASLMDDQSLDVTLSQGYEACVRSFEHLCKKVGLSPEQS